MDIRAAIVCAAACAAAAQGQWTYQVLTPPDQVWAFAYGLGPGGSMVGAIGTTQHGAVWSSITSSNVVDVNPSGATESDLLVTTGLQHVGIAVIGGVTQAGVWNGNSAGSFTSLAPSGYTVSYAMGTDGIRQSGWGTTPAGQSHALLWSGSAASAVILDPVNAVHARAYQTAAGRQVGYAEFAPLYTTPVAGYWQGTAASWTVLSTPAPFRDAVPTIISPDGQEQGGYATGPTGYNQAVLWHGVSGPFVSLNPSGFVGSNVQSTTGRFQAGSTLTLGFGNKAAVWEGSAASFFDLSTVLPPQYGASHALSVVNTATDVWVAGYAYNPGMNRNDAIVWHETIPAPGTVVPVLGAMAVAQRRRRGNGSLN